MEFKELIELIQTVSDSSLTGFKYEKDGVCINMQKKKETIAVSAAPAVVAAAPAAEMAIPVPAAVPAAPAAEGAAETTSEEKPGKLIKSPLVGTFYAAPSEDAEPFVTEGTQVRKGQTVAIVEAMKLMNEIECEFDGTVAEILVSNGEAVEYGQPLFRIV